MRMRAGIVLAVVALMAAGARGGYVPVETIDSLSRKAEILVVGEVVKIETVSKDKAAGVLHQRATVKVLRGIKAADTTPVGLETVRIEYLASDLSEARVYVGVDRIFPNVAMGRPMVFPLKRPAPQAAEDGTTWKLVAENGVGMTLPAVAAELPVKVTTPSEFLYRELAGNFVAGDAINILVGASYFQMPDPNAPDPLPPVEALLQSQIKENDRWLHIAAAAYLVSGVPEGSVAQIMSGKSERSTLRLCAFALERFKSDHVEDDMIVQLVEDQSIEPVGAARVLQLNPTQSGAILKLEEQALAKGKPGSIAASAFLISDGRPKDPAHPLLKPVLAAARVCMGTAPARDDYAAHMDFQQSIEVLLHSGSNDDFARVMERTAALGKEDPGTIQALLTYASSDWGPRALTIGRQYIDVVVPAPGILPTGHEERVCDEAGIIVQKISNVEFGLKMEDSVETRDLALGRIREWLKSR